MLGLRCKSIFAAFLLAITPFPGFANESALISPEEGFWVMGMKSSKESITFELTIVDKIGQLVVKSWGWQGLQFSTCYYVFSLDGKSVGEVYLNEGRSSNPEGCFDEFPMTFDRLDDNVLKVTFDKEIGETIGLSELDFVSRIRPLREQDRVELSAPLDIIGIKPGMKRDEIDEVLLKKGYSLDMRSDDGLKDVDYPVPIDRWVKGGIISDGNYTGKSRDTIWVVFNSVKSWLEQDRRAIIIHRSLRPDLSDGLRASDFQESVQEKYGFSIERSGRERHFYSRQGAVVDWHSECGDGPLTVLRPVGISWTGLESLYLSPNCMGSVETEIISNFGNGIISHFLITVGSVDEYWQELWETWSKGEYDYIARVLSVLRANGEVPEL